MIYKRIKKIAEAHLKTVLDKAEFKPPRERHSDTWHSTPPPVQKSPATDKETGYYANLELKPGASFSEIKAGYRRLMSQYHPDKFSHDEEKRRVAEEVTIQLNEAWGWFKKKHQS